jgi:hypothetical protein
LMNFRLKYLTEIKKRWTWKSPQTAIISEPLDIDYLAYNVAKNLRGYNGFIKGTNHTTTSFLADRSVYLATGATYSAHIRHKNTVEESTVSNTPGATYSLFNLSTPLTFTPESGDIWVIGEVDNHVQTVQIDDLEFDGETFILRAHEHVQSIYTDVVTDVTELENVAGMTPTSPPLLDAQALSFGSAGITQGYLFNVVPSFSFLSGTYSDLSGTTLRLSPEEPDTDDFFNGAYIQADLDSPRIITDYDGGSKIATVASSFLLAASHSELYNINWPMYSPFNGFLVEGLSGATWTELDSAVGTSLTILTGSTYSMFRFTPLNEAEEPNEIARVLVPEGRIDTTPPFPPLSLTLTTDTTRTGIASLDLLLPLDRDVQYVDVEFTTGLTQGDTFLNTLYDISVHRNEKNTNTPLEILVDVDLSSFNFGTVFNGRASTLDFFGNRSPWIAAFNSITLSADDTNSEDPEETIIGTDGGTVGVTTGAGRLLLFRDTIDGGTIGENNALQLDLNLLITPGSTLTTTIDFDFLYGGVSANILSPQISDGATKIPDESMYWLTFYLSPLNGTALAQDTIVKKTGPEVPTNEILSEEASIEVDSGVDQLMEVYATINGDTTTEIEVINASLKQIEDPQVGAEDEYIIGGTIPTRPQAGIVALVHPFSRSVTFPVGLFNSRGYAKTVAGTTATFSLKRIDQTTHVETEFGTMVFAGGTNTGTFSAATETAFVRGDIFTITAPNPADSLLADVGWSILGRKV